MKLLNTTSFGYNITDFIQTVHNQNRELQAQWGLTYIPDHSPKGGNWGFHTDSQELWDRVVSRCEYYRELDFAA